MRSGGGCERRAWRRAVVAPALALLAATAAAQDAEAPRRGFSLTPYVRLGATLTDNAQLSAHGDADLIATAGAGVSVRSNAGRVRGFLDYELTGITHTRRSVKDEFQNALRASANAELIDHWLFLDAAASISQQLVSPFGSQSTDPTIANDNRTEVRTLMVSPSARTTIANRIDVEGRVSLTATQSDSSQAADSRTVGASLRLGQAPVVGRFGWSASVSRQNYDFSNNRETENDSAEASLIYSINPEVTVWVLGGREANNFSSLDKEGHNFSGVGGRWSPSGRTSFTAERRKRYFGSSHSVSFSHRTRRTIWTYADSRDISTGTQPVLGRLGTIYELLFAQLATEQPDPIQRDALVRFLLLSRGIPPGAEVFASFLSSSVLVQRSQQASVAWLSARNTLTLALTRTDGSRLDTLTSVLDAFSGGNEIRQRGGSLTLSHRLSERSTLSAFYNVTLSDASVTQQSAALRTLSTSLISRATPRSDFSLGGRYARFAGSESYIERALFGTYRQQF